MVNADSRTVEGFGQEWTKYDQSELSLQEKESIFADYFSNFPWSLVSKKSIGADLGCGSGRWASLMAPHVGKLFLVDASQAALSVAKKNLSFHPNLNFVHASFEDMPIPDNSLDFAYSLGVLHHVPDTQLALQHIARKLKPGAPFLVYLYYAFDHSPLWFKLMWSMSNGVRRMISRLPFGLRSLLCLWIAALVYFPLARTAKRFESLTGFMPKNWPLNYYRNKSFYVMKTDALDRFGTRLEKRFSRKQIQALMEAAGFEKITFSDSAPYWVAVGNKKMAEI